MTETDKRNDVKVKICGIRRECDVDFINEAMPDYIGFVFAESKRRVEVKAAEQLRKRVSGNIKVTGVFVDACTDTILHIAEKNMIDMIQLHGEESPSYAGNLKKQLGLPIIKAVGHYLLKEKSKSEVIRFLREYEEAGVDYFLFDTAGTGRGYAGGTGRCFDWTLLPRTGIPFFLAGGLNSSNIETAITQTNPYAVDISSGVETEGVKDREKIIEIVQKIRKR